MSTSRTISWQQQVIEADPKWLQTYLRPVIYEFSNGRTFVDRSDRYTSSN